MVSCKPIETVKYINKTDSVYIENTLYDSIYIKEYTKGDTVFITKDNIKYQILYKDRYKCDTVIDTIQTVKYITKEKKASQKPFKWYFLGIITTVLIIAIGKYVKVFHFK